MAKQVKAEIRDQFLQYAEQFLASVPDDEMRQLAVCMVLDTVITATDNERNGYLILIDASLAYNEMWRLKEETEQIVEQTT